MTLKRGIILVSFLFALNTKPVWAVIEPVDYTQTIQPAEVITDVTDASLCRLVGDLVISAGGSALSFTPVTDPYAPGSSTTVILANTITEFVCDAEHLFASVADVGVQKVDISDPAHPEVVETWHYRAPNLNLVWAGGLLTLQDEVDHVIILDPVSLRPLGEWVAGHTVNDMIGLGDPAQPLTRYLYLGTGAGLEILSLADPSAPVLASQFTDGCPDAVPDSPPIFTRMSLDGGTLAVTGLQYVMPDEEGADPYYTSYFCTLDIQDPVLPAYLAWSRAIANRLTIGDGIAVTTNSTYFSIRNLVDLGVTAKLAAPSNINDMDTLGSILVLAVGSKGLALYDFTFPTQVLSVATYGTDRWYQGVSNRFSLGYTIDGFIGDLTMSCLTYHLYDLADPLAPVVIFEDTFCAFGIPSVAVTCRQDNLMMLAEMSMYADGPAAMGYTILDASSSPAMSAAIPFGTSCQGAGITGTTLWIYDYDYLLKAYDASALPSLPLLSETFFRATDGFYQVSISAAGSFMYSSGEGLIRGLDLSNPLQPVLGAAMPLPQYGGVAMLGGLFVFRYNDGLKIVDLADLQAPKVVGDLTTAFAVNSIFIHEDRAVLATEDGFQILDLSSPADPAQLSPLVPFPKVNSYAWQGNTLYVPSSSAGLSAFDVSQPAQPRLLGMAFGFGTAIYANSEFLIQPNAIFPLHAEGDNPSAVHEPGQNALSAGAQLSAYPNPFNAHTMVSFSLAEPARVKLMVYDLAGRRVALLAEKVFEAGDHRVFWDGSDALGQPVASGTYIIELRSDSERSCRKALLVK